LSLLLKFDLFAFFVLNLLHAGKLATIQFRNFPSPV
jgi:hypothetical protein